MLIKPQVARWAVPLLTPCRYKGARGGRSGGKSHQLCEITAADMCANPNFKVAGVREVHNSIAHSLKPLLEQKIHGLGGSYLFDFQKTVIKRRGGDGVAAFLGMQDHTADSVKGLEGFDRALVDEANALSKTSLKKLTPTFRAEGSEVHFAWNPENEEDAVDKFFAANAGYPGFRVVDVCITDNPWASSTAKAEYEREKLKADQARQRVAEAKAKGVDPEDEDLSVIDEFNHVWLGQYNLRSQRIVFHNWRLEEIETPDNVVWFYGGDFGFSVDPSAGVKCCYLPQPPGRPDILYFRQAISQVGVRTDDLPEFFSKLEGIEKWGSVADSARPDTIDFLRRNGLPKMRGAKKGQGSVEDGVSFLQGVDIVLHPTDCRPLEKELKAYSYKVLKHSGEILPVVEDANNHCIDASRYAIEKIHRRGKLIRSVIGTTAPSKTAKGYSAGRSDDDLEAWKVV